MNFLAAALASAIAAAVNASGVKDALRPYVERREIPGYVSVLIDGDREEMVVDGWSNIEKKSPMREDSLFRICSQTKGIVGAAAAKLVVEGKLSLDDPVSKYLPEFRRLERVESETNGVKTLVTAKNVLTVRHCLSHTGGFPFETRVSSALGWAGAPLRVAASIAAATPLLSEPGTAYKYSNAGIDVAGAVIEAVTKEGIEDHLRRVFFTPLGMTDTTFRPTAKQLERLVDIYWVKTNTVCRYAARYNYMPGPYDSPNHWQSCGAGLFSTPRDMREFFRMLAFGGVARDGRRILPEKAIEILATKQTPPAVGRSYSLGMSVERDGWFGHDGALKTAAQVNPKRHVMWLWMMQCEYSGQNRWHQNKVWMPLVKRFFEESAKKDSPCGTSAPASCERAVVEGFNPVFSQDGSSIAFQRLEDGIFKLGVVGADGGDVKWIEEGPGNAAYPEWTPAGGLVYTAGHDYETAYEGWSRKSTNGYNLFLWENGGKRRLTSGRCRDYTPSVTPDGKKVYFITTRYSATRKKGETLPVTIAELDLEDGCEPRPAVVMSTEPAPGGYNSGFVQPAVSPDGKTLLWSLQDESLEDTFWRIYGADVGRFDRRDWRRITPDDVVGLAPRWHPGGRLICYTGFRRGEPCWGVYVQSLETGKARRLASGANPAFSPDGKSIAYDRGGVVYVRPFGPGDDPCGGNCGEGMEGLGK